MHCLQNAVCCKSLIYPVNAFRMLESQCCIQVCISRPLPSELPSAHRKRG